MPRSGLCPGIAALVVFSAIAAAQDASTPAPTPLIVIEITEPEPGVDQLLAGAWPLARRQRADRIVFAGRVHTVQTLVAELRSRKLDEQQLILACHAAQPSGRFLAVADALRKAELGGKALRVALASNPEKSVACDVVAVGSSFIRVSGQSGVIRIGGGEPDADAESYRTVAFDLENDRGETVLAIGEGNERKKHRSRNEMREALEVAMDGEGDDARDVRGRVSPTDDVRFGDLFATLALLRDLHADRIEIARGIVTDFADWAARWATDSRDWIGDEIANGLKTLASVQKPIGSWTGRSIELDDVGRTGLALLTFMAEFHTPEEGEHAATVASGLRYLIQKQDSTGVFVGATSDFSVNQVIATRAMVEAYGVTGDETYESSAQRGLRVVVRAQRKDGGWASIGAEASDLLLTTWAAMAIRAADDSGLEVDTAVLEKTSEWVDGGRREDGGTSRGTRLAFGVDRFFGRHPESLAMISLLVRNRLGVDTEELRETERRVLAVSPNEDNGNVPDYDYLFFGSLALNDVGSTHWEPWRKELDVAVFRCLAAARGETDGAIFFGGERKVTSAAKGADPAATAYLTLCLINSYRFSRSFEAPK